MVAALVVLPVILQLLRAKPAESVVRLEKSSAA
jgi:hypothetical protein